MPSWSDILAEIGITGSPLDVIRRRYLKNLFDITGRNTIVYYSGWLQKPDNPYTNLNETDKNGFMAAIHGLDRTKGLDLILHTPGGDVAVTESLIFYLHEMFGGNIRAIVPQIAMSAGTMIALSCSEIVLGKHSSLGPIDPQYGGVSAHAIVEEFKRAHDEIRRDQTKAFVWQPILNRYPPTLIGECEKSMKWAEEVVMKCLTDCMFASDADRDQKARHVVQELADHALTKSHARRISVAQAKELGLKIVDLEANQDFQEAVMSVHHATVLTLDKSPACKIVENHLGVAYIGIAGQIIQLAPQ